MLGSGPGKSIVHGVYSICQLYIESLYYEREEIIKEAKKHRDTAPSHHTQNMGMVGVVANLPCWWECVGTILMKRRGTS